MRLSTQLATLVPLEILYPGQHVLIQQVQLQLPVMLAATHHLVFADLVHRLLAAEHTLTVTHMAPVAKLVGR